MKEVDVLTALTKDKIIPVAEFQNPAQALKTAEIVLQNSLSVLEITLRTKAAIDCISAVRNKFPELIIGAGSVLSPDDLQHAYREGADFAVSPCYDQLLIEAVPDDTLYIPGVATPSELNQALKHLHVIKIFPSKALGGPDYIKSVIAPFVSKEMFIIPTGGINENNILEYYAINNVIACGMSSIVDKRLLHAGEYDTIDQRIKNVVKKINSLGC